MKRLFIIGILFLFIHTLRGQSSTNDKKNHVLEGFIEIKIRSGYTSYGTISLTLQREGFIYWSNPFLAGIPEEAKFIPFKDLDTNKVFKIWQYIFEQKIPEIEKLSEKYIYNDSIYNVTVETFSTKRPILLSFTIHERNKFSSYEYKYYDERIDKLINLMNELIPIYDKERFSIKGPER